MASSEVRWYSLNNESRDDNVNLATRGFLELADEYISVGTDQEEETSFFIERKPKRSLGYDNKFQNSITYEMSLDQERYVRRVSTILDLFSELGGLFTSISRIFLLIIAGVNYFGSYQFVMA